MKAIILAAGEGTRLRPVTNVLPKCLARIGGISLLDYQLNVLNNAGIEDITVVGGYKSHMLEGRAPRLLLNPDYDKTNMVHTLFCAEEKLEAGEDVIISYGDIVFEQKVLDSLLSESDPIALVVDTEWRRYWSTRMEDPLQDAETMKLDSDGRIVELGKKPQSYDDINGQYIGLIKISGEWIQALKEAYRDMDRSLLYDGKDFPNMYMTSFLQYLIDEGWHVKAAPVSNGWLETDSLEDIKIYHRLIEEKLLTKFFDYAGAAPLDTPSCSTRRSWEKILTVIHEISSDLPAPCSEGEGFLTEDFILGMVSGPLEIFSERTWGLLDSLCKKIDVVGKVLTCYTDDLSKKMTEKPIADTYLSALTALLLLSACVYSDLKFLNSAFKALDLNGKSKFNEELRDLSLEIFQGLMV